MTLGDKTGQAVDKTLGASKTNYSMRPGYASWDEECTSHCLRVKVLSFCSIRFDTDGDKFNQGSR